jgi:hypothetical protein
MGNVFGCFYELEPEPEQNSPIFDIDKFNYKFEQHLQKQSKRLRERTKLTEQLKSEDEYNDIIKNNSDDLFMLLMLEGALTL